MGEGMHLKKNNLYNQDPKPSLFRNFMRESDMDDSTFHEWKSELLKELPAFWEQINEGFKK